MKRAACRRDAHNVRRLCAGLPRSLSARHTTSNLQSFVLGKALPDRVPESKVFQVSHEEMNSTIQQCSKPPTAPLSRKILPQPVMRSKTYCQKQKQLQTINRLIKRSLSVFAVKLKF